MDRQSEIEYYGIPTLNFPRSTKQYETELQTTGNIGDIIPIYVNNLVQPGDTFSIDENIVINFNASKTPTMGLLYKDTYWFALPYIPIWKHTKEFFGENKSGAWVNDTEYEIPKIKIGGNMSKVKPTDIINRLGVPAQTKANEGANLGETEDYIEQLSYRMYLMIYNYYFRNQNFIAPIKIPDGDETLEYTDAVFKDNSSYVWEDGTYPRSLLKAMRMHDYFTTIPEPQYGGPSTLSLGVSAPVKRDEGEKDYRNVTIINTNHNNERQRMLWKEINGNDPATSSINSYAGTGKGSTMGIASGADRAFVYNGGLYGKITPVTHLYADLTNAVSATINAIRIDATIQQIREQLAWFGSMYQNIVKSLWGVTIPEEIIQIPEYLGGKRDTIDMVTVLQSSQTTSDSPQGTPTGYSNDMHSNKAFTKSFSYHGIIMGVCVIRQDHIYSQGIPVRMKKFRKYDFYWNAFKGLGAQPIDTNEIFWTGKKGNTWGYRPAWREYEVEPSRVNGYMQPGIQESLAVWNYADYYLNEPVQSAEWLNETTDFVDRTLFVPSTLSQQFRLDCVFNVTKVTEVPNFNLPGIERF